MAPNGKLTSIKNHPLYYIKGGDLIIIVDDTRFLVPSIFFVRESPVFRERLESQVSSDPTGKSPKAQEIIIQAEENVTPDDFSQLCWVFLNPKLSTYETTLQKWESILRLANQYKFPEAKDLAFREIDKAGAFKMTLIDRVVLYRKYEAEKRYLENLYVELLSRPEPLSIEEGNKLTLQLALLISGARERLRAASDRLSISDPLPESTQDTVKAMVASMFWGGPAPDLSRLASITSTTAPPSGSSATTPATGRAMATTNGAPNGTDTGSVFGSGFGVAGKKGKKKNGILGDWDEL